jgi:hypothetical protein
MVLQWCYSGVTVVLQMFFVYDQISSHHRESHGVRLYSEGSLHPNLLVINIYLLSLCLLTLYVGTAPMRHVSICI